MSARMSARTFPIALLLASLLLAAGCDPNPPKPGGKAKGDAGPASKTAPRGSGEEREDTTLYAVDVIDAQTAFAWGTNDSNFVGSVVLKTADGGAHWAC